MRRLGLVPSMLVLGLACGSETAPTTGSTGSAAAASTRAGSSETPAPAEPSEASEAAMAELYVDGFYRSEGGRVITAMPPAVRDHGKVELTMMGGRRTLVADFEGGRVFFNLLPPGDYDSEAAAQKLRTELTASVAASVNLDALPLRTINEQGPGGKLYGFRHGPAPDSGAVATIVLIVDGRDAAVLLGIGKQQPIDDAVAWFTAHTRVGAKVPRLEPRAPGQALAGAFATAPKAIDGSLHNYWLRFDARGYASDESPRDLVSVDMAAMVQAAAVGLRDAYTYEVRGDQLVLTALREGDQSRTKTFAAAGPRKLTIGGSDYLRVDGLIPDGTTYQGTYEHFSGSSIGFGADSMTASTTKRFRFGPGNQVSFSGGTSVVGSSTNAAGLLDSTMGGYVDSGTWSGTYEVRDERLIIRTSEGLTIERPLAAVLFNGKVSPRSLTIGGLIYTTE